MPSARGWPIPGVRLRLPGPIRPGRAGPSELPGCAQRPIRAVRRPRVVSLRRAGRSCVLPVGDGHSDRALHDADGPRVLFLGVSQRALSDAGLDVVELALDVVEVCRPLVVGLVAECDVVLDATGRAHRVSSGSYSTVAGSR